MVGKYGEVIQGNLDFRQPTDLSRMRDCGGGAALGEETGHEYRRYWSFDWRAADDGCSGYIQPGVLVNSDTGATNGQANLRMVNACPSGASIFVRVDQRNEGLTYQGIVQLAAGESRNWNLPAFETYTVSSSHGQQQTVVLGEEGATV